jgi:hypothetical protein
MRGTPRRRSSLCPSAERRRTRPFESGGASPASRIAFATFRASSIACIALKNRGRSSGTSRGCYGCLQIIQGDKTLCVFTNTQQREHVNAFVDVAVRRALERLAHENDRSLSAEIRRALAAHVERERGDEEDE